MPAWLIRESFVPLTPSTVGEPQHPSCAGQMGHPAKLTSVREVVPVAGILQRGDIQPLGALKSPEKVMNPPSVAAAELMRVHHGEELRGG